MCAETFALAPTSDSLASLCLACQEDKLDPVPVACRAVSGSLVLRSVAESD